MKNPFLPIFFKQYDFYSNTVVIITAIVLLNNYELIFIIHYSDLCNDF